MSRIHREVPIRGSSHERERVDVPHHVYILSSDRSIARNRDVGIRFVLEVPAYRRIPPV